jgi:hypothetical protein
MSLLDDGQQPDGNRRTPGSFTRLPSHGLRNRLDELPKVNPRPSG